MNTPITLQRTVAIEGWRVTGTIAIATRREWEPALLKLAVQHGDLTSDVVAAELLGGRSSVARRLLELCRRLGLLAEQRGAAFDPHVVDCFLEHAAALIELREQINRNPPTFEELAALE